MKKVAKENIDAIEELILQDLMKAGIDDDFTTTLVRIQLRMNDSQCSIPTDVLFRYGNYQKSMQQRKDIKRFLHRHNLPYETEIMRKAGPDGKEYEYIITYISLDTIKYIILRHDKNNPGMHQLKKYFIMAEQRVFEYLLQNQDLDYDNKASTQNNDKKHSSKRIDQHAKNDGCYFYIIRVTNSTASGRERKIEHNQKNINVFKYGMTKDLTPRMRAYNVGRLYKIQFHYFVKVTDCAKLEREFANEMQRYHVF